MLLEHPRPRAFIPPRRCPRCGKRRRLIARNPRRVHPRWRRRDSWRRAPAGLYVPPTVVDAAGDVLLDDDGNVILDASGNVMLSDGAGDDCCCGEGPYCTDCVVAAVAPPAPAALGCLYCGAIPNTEPNARGCTPRYFSITFTGGGCSGTHVLEIFFAGAGGGDFCQWEGIDNSNVYLVKNLDNSWDCGCTFITTNQHLNSDGTTCCHREVTFANAFAEPVASP